MADDSDVAALRLALEAADNRVGEEQQLRARAEAKAARLEKAIRDALDLHDKLSEPCSSYYQLAEAIGEKRP